MFAKVTLYLCLQLVFNDVESDGTHNYLVKQRYSGNTRQYLVAFNADKDVNWIDGCYEMEGECDSDTWALDDPLPSEYMSWGHPRVAPICNAFRIEGRHFIWQEKSK